MNTSLLAGTLILLVMLFVIGLWVLKGVIKFFIFMVKLMIALFCLAIIAGIILTFVLL